MKCYNRQYGLVIGIICIAKQTVILKPVLKMRKVVIFGKRYNYLGDNGEKGDDFR